MQKTADQVRVNVQLINAQTDFHLWAETYDRKLTDILGVESDIAKRIAESLQAKLSGHEEQALAVKPTNNPEAYDAYLRGLAFEVTQRPLTHLGRREPFYERAVQLDPNFAIAWARLSRAEALSTLTVTRVTVLVVTQRNVLWRTRRDWSRTHLKPCSPWVTINIRCSRDYGLPKRRSIASAKCYQATARHPSPRLSCPTRGTLGIKALPTSSKPLPWTHVTSSYSTTWHPTTLCFNNSRPR